MKLDDRLGPALPLSREAEEKLIASALDQAYPIAKRRRWIPIAAAALVLIGAPAAIAAWMTSRAEKPIVAPAPPAPPPPKPRASLPPPPPAEAVEEQPPPAGVKP